MNIKAFIKKKKNLYRLKKKIRIIYQQKKDFLLFSQRFIGRTDTFAYAFGKIAVENLVILLLVQMSGNMAFVTNLQIKCSDCKSRQLLPITQEVLYSHLTGQQEL